MPSHAVPAPGTGNARLEQALAVAHQAAAAGWLAAAAIAPAPEGIMYGLLAATSALRWRAVADAVISGPARIPLRVLGALLAWSVASSLIAGGFAGAVTGIPGRTSLAPFLVAAAGLGPRWLVGATVVPGMYWAVLLVLQKFSPAPWQARMIPHPSVTFLGLQWLCALGIAAAGSTGPMRARTVGALCGAVSMLGAALAQSRTLAMVMVASLAMLPLTAADRRGRTVRALGCVSIMMTALLLLWMSPVGQKALHQWTRARNLALKAPSPGYIAFDNFLSHRWDLHTWTCQRATSGVQPLFLGRGNGSWRRDFNDPASSRHPGDPRAALTIKSSTHAHQLYLQTLYEQGAIGLTLLCALIMSLMAPAWRNRCTHVLAAAAVACVGMTVLVGLVEGEWMSKPFMATVAWLLAASTAPRDEFRTTRGERASEAPPVAADRRYPASQVPGPQHLGATGGHDGLPVGAGGNL